MESSGEEEAVTLRGEIDIKEETVLTDTYCQPFEEIEQIYIQEENGLEIPEDNDAHDPLQVKKEECVSDEETTSLPDVKNIKKESEVNTEGESTSCSSEPESISPVDVEDYNRTEENASLVTAVDLDTSTGNTIKCTTRHEAPCEQESSTLFLVLSCSYCRKTFAHLQDLKDHKHEAPSDFRHSCDVCRKTFRNIYDLMRHFRVHTGERPYSCHVCHKAFTTRSNLWQHSRVHVPGNPYACDLCHKTFKHSKSLRIHYLRAHSG